MEKRTAKVNISAAGGTAAKGSRTCKVTLPTTWLEAMGVSESRRELELSFDGERITLSRPDAASDTGHDVRTFRFYDGQRLCTTIRADFTAEIGEVLSPALEFYPARDRGAITNRVTACILLRQRV